MLRSRDIWTYRHRLSGWWYLQTVDEAYWYFHFYPNWARYLAMVENLRDCSSDRKQTLELMRSGSTTASC